MHTFLASGPNNQFTDDKSVGSETVTINFSKETLSAPLFPSNRFAVSHARGWDFVIRSPVPHAGRWKLEVLGQFHPVFLPFPSHPAENGELSREYEESQSRLNQILRIKTSLTSQVDDYKRQLDEESKVGLGMGLG